MASSSAVSGMPSSGLKSYDQVGKEDVISELDDFSYGTSVATSMDLVRLGFIRKVYTILTIQLLATTVVAGICMLVAPVREAILAAPWLMLVAMFGSLGTLVALTFMKDKHPTNLYLLTGFTFLESIAIGSICAIYQEAGAGHLVLQAFLLTSLIFGSLTAYCHFSKKDFSFLGGFLYASLVAIIGATLINVVLGFTGNYSPGFAFAISCVGVLVFTGFILYDTSVLLTRLSPDEYIMGAISLYLDFLNLFLEILRILSHLQDRN